MLYAEGVVDWFEFGHITETEDYVTVSYKNLLDDLSGETIEGWFGNFSYINEEDE